jgi:hypothetical protein
VTLTGGGSTALYRAYVGRAKVVNGSPIDVFIDDLTASLDGRTRTWFDGVGYAPVINLSPADLNADGQLGIADFQALLNGLHTSVNGLPRDVAFAQGDINADLTVDFHDFQLFRSEYTSLHGAEAFSLLTADVPEPSAAWLAVLATGVVCHIRSATKKASSSESTRPL